MTNDWDELDASTKLIILESMIGDVEDKTIIRELIKIIKEIVRP